MTLMMRLLTWNWGLGVGGFGCEFFSFGLFLVLECGMRADWSLEFGISGGFLCILGCGCTSVSYVNDASQNGGMCGTIMMSSVRCQRDSRPPNMMFFQYMQGERGCYTGCVEFGWVLRV